MATIIDLARWLRERKENGQRTMLFLGSRAGGLFRSKTFYSTARSFSKRAFYNTTQTQQFGECYHALDENEFDRSDIHSILVTSLQSLKVAEADLHLARLVQDGFFDMIISTNIDNLLLRAFEEVGMEQERDFQIFIPQQQTLDKLMSQQRKDLFTLVKISGDLDIGEYSLFKQNFYFERHDGLKAFFSSTFSSAMLILGYDPFWDRAVDTVLPLAGQPFWYVNEDPPGAALAQILHNRAGEYISGGECGYAPFMQKLHWYLEEERSLHELAPHDYWHSSMSLSSSSPGMYHPVLATAVPTTDQPQQSSKELLPENEVRTSFFIGYCNSDRRFLKELKAHMAYYEREKLLDAWDDQKVKPGMHYQEELQAALKITKVAILLVSADFLASDFIARDILPPLLQMASQGGAIILPVTLKPCVIEGTVLQQFQPFNPSTEPLSSKKPHGRNMVWAELVRYLITLRRDSKHEQ